MTLTQECKAYLAQVFYIAMCLSFSPTYATETMTYYAFVMYKAPSVGSTWELPDMETLKPGRYRFQIVRLRLETFFTRTIALRGEFKFVADPAGGVNLSEKETLDSSQEVVTGNKLNSLWLKTPVDQADSWEEGGLPWVQALINEMNRSGEPDANLIRFLVLKKSAKSEWLDKKNINIYILYRLHYEGLQDMEYLEALSRFINPNQAPSIEIYRLRQWIREQDHFEKADYLGQADERHKEFYEDFQKVSKGFLDQIDKRQAQKYIVKAENKIEEAKSSLADANKEIVKAEQGDQSDSKEQLIEFANGSLSLAEDEIYAAQDELDKAKEKIGESGVADVQKRIDEVEAKIESARQQLIGLVKVPTAVHAPKTLGESIDILIVILLSMVGGVAIFLLVMFFKNLKDRRDRDDDDYLPHARRRGKTRTGTPPTLLTPNKRGSDESTDAGEQNDPFLGVKFDKPIDRGYGDSRAVPSPQPSADYVLKKDSRAVPSPQPSADYVLKKDIDGIIENLKHDLNKIAENQALAVLSNHFGELFQENIQQLQEDFENIIDQRIKEQLVIKLESIQAKRPIQDEPVQTSSNTEPISERITVELSNELRAYLENNNLFDENLWLALWRGDPSPCELAKRLLLDYQPLTIENYEELAAWLEKASGNEKVYFIIPTLNHECDSNLHEIVEERGVKGVLNRVLEIKRPGLGCDEGVALKAQVVSSR